MRTKIVALLMAVCLLMMSIPSMAMGNEDICLEDNELAIEKTELDKLYDNLTLMYLRRNIIQENGSKEELDKIDENILILKQAITKQGGQEVDINFVKSLNNNTPYAINSDPEIVWDPYPADGINDEFFVSGPYTYSYNTTTYRYMEVRVVPTTLDSELCKVTIIDVEGPTAIQAMAGKAIRMFIEEIAGLVFDEYASILAWMLKPMQIIMNKDPSVIEMQGEYIIVNNVAVQAKYIYVCGPNDDWTDQYNYYLSLLHHSFSYADTHVFNYIENGIAQNEVTTTEGVHDFPCYPTPRARAIQNFRANRYYEIIAPGQITYTWGDDKEIVRRVELPAGYYNPDGM